ncbi:MAG: MFS transporter [Propionicimonas sp.]|uniref:MFS transporter n=1 Tax=Propionicimonas sp. TaxID=1955623 RepID=UPI003D0F5113
MFRPAPAPLARHRARLMLLGAFALSGLISFSWLARIPGVRDDLHLGAAELGVVLLVGSTGALVTVFSAPLILGRIGSARMFGAGSVVMTGGFTLMGVGPALGSLEAFGLGIVLNGIGGALLNVPMNVESARIEQAYGRAVIPHFHAAFSLGAVGGSVLGALSAALGVSVVAQFAVVGVLVGALRLVALAGGLVMPGAPRPTADTAARGAAPARGRSVWTEPRTLLVGVVAFAAAISEGAANNWLSLAFVDGFGATEAFGGLVLGVFIGSMAVVRAFGTRAIDRLGRVATLQLSGLFGVAGLALFALTSRPQVALVGVALWGMGAALCFPLAVAAVSDDPWKAPARVSVMASLGSVAAMTASPMIGLAADALGGTRHALLVVLVALLASLAVSRFVGPSLSRVADPRDALDAEPVAVA